MNSLITALIFTVLPWFAYLIWSNVKPKKGGYIPIDLESIAGFIVLVIWTLFIWLIWALIN